MHASASSTPSELRAILGELGLPAPQVVRSPDRALEQLLNLPRCVELVHVLDRHEQAASGSGAGNPRGPAGAAQPRQTDDPQEAERARVRLAEGALLARLTSLREQTKRRFASALTGLRPAPNAAAVHARLHDQAALQPGKLAVRERLAQRLADRYAAVTRGALTVVLKELTLTRQDVQVSLRECGGRIAELCELDQLYDGMFRAELQQTFAQLERALSRKLQAALLQEMSALSSDCSESDLAPWFLPDGCVGAFLGSSARLVHAVLDLEWSPLMGLVQGARAVLAVPLGDALQTPLGGAKAPPTPGVEDAESVDVSVDVPEEVGEEGT